MLTIKKRPLLVLALVALLLVAAAAGYVYRNPPLSTPGWSISNIDEGAVVVHLVNNGFFNISLKEVVINGHESPTRVELGTSTSGLMVMGGPDEHPDITFHGISEVKIQPELTGNKMDKAIQALLAGERGHIFHYGIVINHASTVKTVTIKYSYLGMNFEHQRAVRE